MVPRIGVFREDRDDRSIHAFTISRESLGINLRNQKRMFQIPIDHVRKIVRS
jgi:hypothetical protein